jgi:hypothetical protein
MPSWFLPPDFTFTDTQLPLGAVIPHPKHPTRVLAALGAETPPIPLPVVQTITETNHTHSNDSSRSAGLQIMTKFLEVASVNTKIDASRKAKLQYSPVNHEVRSFAAPFIEQALAATAQLPAVKRHVESGLFRRRAVYIISGLRVATESFTVTKERGGGVRGEVGASGPMPAGPVPVEVGGGVSGSREIHITDSYNTAPGIVFAYRLHVLRPRREGGADADIFAHRTAFLTGDGGEDGQGEEMEVVEVGEGEVNDDLDETTEFRTLEVGDGECCIAFDV